MKKAIILLAIICNTNVFSGEKRATPYRPGHANYTTHYTLGIKFDNVSLLGASLGYIWLRNIERYDLADATKGLLTEIEFAIRTGKLNLGYIRKTISLAGSTGWSAKASYLHRWQEGSNGDDSNYLGFMLEGWVFYLGGSVGLYSGLESGDGLFLIGISLRL